MASGASGANAAPWPWGLDPMDIRLSDGDRIGKPKGKTSRVAAPQPGRPAERRGEPEEPQLTRPRGPKPASQAQASPRAAPRSRSELRAEPRVDARDSRRAEARYQAYDDVIPDGRGNGDDDDAHLSP